jgi:hypothetical protein
MVSRFWMTSDCEVMADDLVLMRVLANINAVRPLIVREEPPTESTLH